MDTGQLEQHVRAQLERLPPGLRPKLPAGERVVIVDNPQASGGRYAQYGAWSQQIYRVLGYDCERVVTTGPGDAVRLAHAAAENGATLVMPCSGDGGVREVAMGLMKVPPERRPKFSVLPKGTVNVFARTLQLQVGPIPDFFHACLKQIFFARSMQVDVARIDGEPFVCFAGFGYDATVIENVPPVEKRVLREWAFVSSAFRTLFEWGPADKRNEPYVPVEMRVSAQDVGGERREETGYLVAIGNVQDYGPGWFPFHPRARIDDGLLDVLVVTTSDKKDMLRIGADVLRHSHLRNPNVRYFQSAGPIRIESLGAPVAAHADCELAGRLHTSEITLEPAALTVVF
jgi:diacylglycerol kinase family enzyme